MPKLRPQYHFRQTQTGFDIWNVHRLIELAKDLPVRFVNLDQISELYDNHWYKHDTTIPSPHSILQHMKLISTCDLEFPIILDTQGRVMDGMHRICKAVLEQHKSIEAVQFNEDPRPDYVDIDPASLPYDEATFFKSVQGS